MTSPNWPSELPRPARDTWQRQAQDPRIKRAGENGPPGYRRKFSGVAKTVNLSVTLDRNQKAVFDGFFERETKFGSVPFTMNDPTTEGWGLATSDGQKLCDEAGVPILMSGQWLCLFGDTMPTETVQGIEFRISFSVVVMP